MQSQSRGKWLFLAILALPAAELLTFIAVSIWIGLAPALLTVVGISLLGVLLFRYQGSIANIRVVTGGQRLSAIDLSEAGLHRWAAAVLLIVPGFLTGAFGALLLIAPVRRVLAGILKKRFGSEVRDPDIVDLPQEDWRVVPQERLENRPGTDRF